MDLIAGCYSSTRAGSNTGATTQSRWRQMLAPTPPATYAIPTGIDRRVAATDPDACGSAVC
jgi:hypothetical protein